MSTSHRQRLHTFADQLSERDWEVLQTIWTFRYLTTRQVARHHFEAVGSACKIPRKANRTLARLRELNLLASLQRRIGGVRAGSAGTVWQITDTAKRLLVARHEQPRGSRVRTFEPSTMFLEHTLAVAEVVLLLQEAQRDTQIAASRFQLEPTSWRTYQGPGSISLTLKPDLAASTTTGAFEDHWFFEIDRDTEPPNRIIKKSLRYQEYRRTGQEQRRLGLFPAVAWIVPNQRRSDQLTRHLEADHRIDLDLFSVVQPTQVALLSQMGSQEFNLRARRKDKSHG